MFKLKISPKQTVRITKKIPERWTGKAIKSTNRLPGSETNIPLYALNEVFVKRVFWFKKSGMLTSSAVSPVSSLFSVTSYSEYTFRWGCCVFYAPVPSQFVRLESRWLRSFHIGVSFFLCVVVAGGGILFPRLTSLQMNHSFLSSLANGLLLGFEGHVFWYSQFKQFSYKKSLMEQHHIFMHEGFKLELHSSTFLHSDCI